MSPADKTIPPSKYKSLQQCHCRGRSPSCCIKGFSITSTPDDRGYTSISSLAPVMVQERLDQMFNERREARLLEEKMRRRKGKRRDYESTFVVMVATKKASYDPRKDFRESIVEMIDSNRIRRPRDLQRLLECYLSVNSDECREVILDVFHSVCTDIFM